MRDKKHSWIAGLAACLIIATLIGGYFGAYVLIADYVDIGDSTPLYLVRYRVASISLHRLAFLFEPARRIDDLCFRQRHATVMEYRVGLDSAAAPATSSKEEKGRSH